MRLFENKCQNAVKSDKMISMKVITFIFLFSKPANCVFIHPVDDEPCKILLKLCNNDFAIPVAKRTNNRERSRCQVLEIERKIRKHR